MAGVDRESPLRGQKLVQRDGQCAGVDAAGSGHVVKRLLAPATAADPLCDVLCAAATRVMGTQCADECLGCRGGVPAQPQIHLTVCAQGTLVDVYLSNPGGGADQVPAAGGPHVQRGAEGHHEVGGFDQLGSDRRRKPAADSDGPRVACEKPVGHRRRRQQGAGLFGKALERRTRSRQNGAPARQQKRTLRRRQPAAEGLHLGRIRRLQHRPPLAAGDLRRRRNFGHGRRR